MPPRKRPESDPRLRVGGQVRPDRRRPRPRRPPDEAVAGRVTSSSGRLAWQPASRLTGRQQTQHPSWPDPPDRRGAAPAPPPSPPPLVAPPFAPPRVFGEGVPSPPARGSARQA